MEASLHPHGAAARELQPPSHSRVRGLECGVSNPKHSNQARDRFATFQPGMSLKNKEVIRRSRDASGDITENKRDSLISGDIPENKGFASSRPARSKALRSTLAHSSTVRQPAFVRVRERRGKKVINFSTFQPGMCMKTNDTARSPRSELRSRKASAAGAPILAPGSLLTPAFQEMTVQPEMLLKTHDREHGTREYGKRGVQILASAFPGTLAPVERAAHARVTGYPGNMLKKKHANPITHHHSPMPRLLTPCS